MELTLMLMLDLLIVVIGIVIIATIGVISVVALTKLYHTLCEKLGVDKNISW